MIQSFKNVKQIYSLQTNKEPEDVKTWRLDETMNKDNILLGYKRIQNKQKVRHIYNCWTCKKLQENVICLPLVKLHHTNHAVIYAGSDEKKCSCGQEEYLRQELGLPEPNGKFIHNFFLAF